MNVLPNELNERVLMGIRGFLNENPHLIHQEDIDNWDEEGALYLDSIFGYLGDGEVDFGKYALSNRYMSNKDESDIAIFEKWEEHRYRIEYDEEYEYDEENIKDKINNCIGISKYTDDLKNIKDKINNFIRIYTIINIEMIFDLIKDIYTNRANEIYLK